MKKLLLIVFLFTISISCKKDNDGYKIPTFEGKKGNTYVYLSCNSCKIDKVVNNNIESTFRPSGKKTYITAEKPLNTILNITYNDPNDELCLFDFVINDESIKIGGNGCGSTTTLKFN